MKAMAVTAALVFSGLVVAASSSQALAQARPRVASVTVCGDLYALMLADRSQIAAVSPEADGPLAYYPERAKGLPRNRGDLESLLAANADIVLLEEGSKPQLERALHRLGVKTIALPFSETFPEIARTIQTVADGLGQHRRGQAVAAAMMARVHALEAERPAYDHRPIALYFRPDGGGSGAGTFMNSLVELAGFRNLQAMTGQTGWTSIPLETVVQNPPQVFITGFFDTQSDSLLATQGSKLAVAAPAHVPAIALPGKDLVCPGPPLVDGGRTSGRGAPQAFPEGRAVTGSVPRIALLNLGLTILIVLLVMASLLIGPAHLSLRDILDGIAGSAPEKITTIVRELRLPRTLLAMLAGGGLGLAGAVLQGFLRNPLAEPGVIGISAAGSLGAVIAIYFGIYAASAWVIPVSAISLCACATIILYIFAARNVGTLTLLLAGIAINSVCLALISLAMNLSTNPYAVSEMVFWLLGSVSNRTLFDLGIASPFVLCGIAVLLRSEQGAGCHEAWARRWRAALASPSSASG